MRNRLEEREPLRLTMKLLLCLSLAAGGRTASAGDFDLFGLEGDYKLTLGYALAARTRKPAEALINGPVDPLQTGGPVAASGMQPAQPASFGRTGLSSTINSDDGDRNFKKYSLFHNRVSALGELQMRGEGYGLVFSGDGFYDDVYRKKNDNNSPSTVNKLGANNEFTKQAKKFDGKRARVLDAYGYVDFTPLEGVAVNLRAGQQVIAFGESLFLRGMALSAGRADATRASVPGAEIKELLLPVKQVGLSVGLDNGLTLLGYYQLEFKPTELFPPGDFLSPVDIIGPGGTFAYGSVNPAAGRGCAGLFGNPEAEGILCGLPAINDTVLVTEPTINVQRGPDIRPSNWGQWGVGGKYPITSTTTLGLYHLRYADSNPTVRLTTGFAPIGQFRNTVTGEAVGPVITTSVINQYVPVTYQAEYFNGIHLTSLTFSTASGPFNFGGEINYRQGSDVQAKAIASKVLIPVFTRGDVGQVLVSVLAVLNPQIFFDEFIVVGEMGYVHVYDVDPLQEQPGIIPVGDGTQLFTHRNSLGYQFLSFLNKRNILPGFDFKTTLSWGAIEQGNPSLSGAFGPIYGEGDRRLGIGFSTQYLQNLEVGISYQKYFGDPAALQRSGAGESPAGGSNLSQNPYADRDYMALNIKYNL